MAAPRVFVSSTFYDLRHVRGDLERFIRSMGYDPVLHEKGSIAYGSQQELEEYCYREIELCDIMVSIVGGRFGSKSTFNEESISQNELRKAHKLGKHIHIFVEKAVLADLDSWKLNRESKEIEKMKFA